MINFRGNGKDRAAGEEQRYRTARMRMVDEQIRHRGIHDPRVIAAMENVPRHLFVPPGDRPFAYDDHPLPIGNEQTISQPYIVALMTEALELGDDDRALEIGSGCGYQAAVLAEIAREVFSVELIDELARSSQERLTKLGYENIRIRVGNGFHGWPEEAPFDAIIVTAAPRTVPPVLIEQLQDGGRLVIPIGEAWQELYRIRKRGERTTEEKLANVRFVPMVGEEDAD